VLAGSTFTPQPQRRWPTAEQYKPYIEQLKKRPEYANEIEKRRRR
jgi:hypothetical protein